jgi:uncharacterized membrane protein YecN with MAPEG domain
MNHWGLSGKNLIVLWVTGTLLPYLVLIYLVVFHENLLETTWSMLAFPALACWVLFVFGLLFFSVFWIVKNGKAKTEKTLIENNTSDYLLYSAPAWKVYLWTLFTFGFYGYYFIYKHWQAIEKVEKRKIYPFARAYFSIFFIHAFFKKCILAAKKRGKKIWINPGALLGFVVLIALMLHAPQVMLLSEDSSAHALGFVLLFFGYILMPMPLVYIQYLVNWQNKKSNSSIPLKHRLSLFEALFLVIVFMLGALLLVSDIPVEDTLSYEEVALSEESRSWELWEMEEDFLIAFPSEPYYEQYSIVDKDGESFTYDSYYSFTEDEKTYIANTIEVDSVGTDSINDILNQHLVLLRDDYASTAEIIENKFFEWDGYSAMSFDIKDNADEFHLKGNFILVEGRLYQVFVEYIEDYFDGENYKHFINSFEIPFSSYGGDAI